MIDAGRAAAQAGVLVVAGSLAHAATPRRFVEIPSVGQTLLLEDPSSAFPESGRPDLALHVPPGFDASRRPGLVVYFHGWNGCVAVAVGDDDAPCTEDGARRAPSRLASQLDAAHVNAMLLALETRADMPTGEVGDLARPGVVRQLLSSVLRDRLGNVIGASLDVDSFARIVVMAHSGGYQGVATTLRFGELPRVDEVVLLDAFYGADDVLFGALRDPHVRFVDLYTYSGGTLERSTRAAEVARASGRDVFVRDDGSLDSTSFHREIVVARVPDEVRHGDLPRVFAREIFASAFDLLP